MDSNWAVPNKVLKSTLSTDAERKGFREQPVNLNKVGTSFDRLSLKQLSNLGAAGNV